MTTKETRDELRKLCNPSGWHVQAATLLSLLDEADELERLKEFIKLTEQPHMQERIENARKIKDAMFPEPAVAQPTGESLGGRAQSHPIPAPPKPEETT